MLTTTQFCCAASDTSSRATARSRGSLNSRAASAPPRPPRFDPTEYVRQRRAREAAASERSHRTFSPSSVRPASRTRSAAAEQSYDSDHSHCSSRDNRCTASDGGTPRLRSAERSRQREQARTAAAAAAQSRSRSTTRQPRNDSPRAQHHSGASGHDARAVSTAARQQSASVHSRASAKPASRAESPGQALQQVKEKLSEYKRSTASADRLSHASGAQSPYQSGQHDHSKPGAVTHAATASPKRSAYAAKVYGDADSEIADIDTRLQALQDFLRNAKGKG